MRWDIVALALVLAVALLARTPRLTASLWLDEGLSLSTAEHLTSFDAQRPLYFLLLRVWMKVADSEIALRLPSVVFGLAWIGVSFLIGHRFGGRRVAILGGLLAALSTSQAFHAQEVRMYSLAALLLSVSALCYLWWVEGGRIRWLVAHGLAAYAAVLTFTLSILGVAGMWLLAMLVAQSKRVAIGTVTTMVIVGLAWLPFAFLAVTETEPTNWITTPGMGAPLFLQAWAFVGPSLYVWLPYDAALWLTRGLAILVVVLALYGAVGTRWIWAALWYFGIVALVFVVSVMLRPIWQPRYFTPFMPVLFLLTARGIDKLHLRSWLAGSAVAVFIFILQTGSLLSDRGPLEDWRAVATLVNNRAAANDVVMVAGDPSDGEPTAWTYYYGETPQTNFISELGTSDEWFDRITSGLSAIERHNSTLWLVFRSGSGLTSEEQEALEKRLSPSFSVQTVRYTNVNVLRISKKA